jgi:hypothetical protein
MIDLLDMNVKAGIGFGLALITALLTYMALFRSKKSR